MLTDNAMDFFVQWHLTERCNLRCRHCYQEGKASQEMSLAEIKPVVQEIADMIEAWSEAYDMSFAPSFNVTGGEPFLRPDLFEILEAMGQKGFELYLLSNGILIDREKAERLSQLGVKGIQVSMEGPERIHESIRGKGSFAATLGGIDQLLTAGLKTTLNMTLSEINAPYLEEMAVLADSLKVDRLGFSRLVPSGRGVGLLPHMLSKEELKDLYLEVFSIRFPGLEIVTGDPVASQMDRFAETVDLGAVPMGGCAAGFSGMTILPDGTVTPCRRLPIPIGNVKEDSLRELWVTSPVLEKLRDRSQYQGKCGSCNRWANCRGCRAVAYACSQSRAENDFLAEDPQCFL
ncbi:MAG: radical SAM protein [Deltaproteobacteria bacterium]|nr:radical SAM protein [Deltaproteobacteria bacterium]